MRISSTRRCASRFTDATRPLPASSTTTPTGEVSTSASASSSDRPEVTKAATRVDRRDHALSGTGQGARAAKHLLEHRVQVQVELMRSTVELSREKRSRSHRFSRFSSPSSFKGPLLVFVRHPPECRDYSVWT